MGPSQEVEVAHVLSGDHVEITHEHYVIAWVVCRKREFARLLSVGSHQPAVNTYMNRAQSNVFSNLNSRGLRDEKREVARRRRSTPRAGLHQSAGFSGDFGYYVQDPEQVHEPYR